MATGETLDVLELEENLSEVERPPDLPPDTYLGEVQGVDVKQSDKGNDYYSIVFKIAADEIPADMREHYEDGTSLTWNRNLVPKKGDRRALFNLRKLVESLGLDANTTQIDPNEWMGRQAKLVCGLGQPYQGERRLEIKQIIATDSEPGDEEEEKTPPKKKAVAKPKRK